MSRNEISFNPEGVSNQGEFAPTRPRNEPLTTKGHAVGELVGNDAKPEFHAQTLPAGTAPKENTFKPNPISETPGQANNTLNDRSHGKESTAVSASDTLGGATSKDTYAGLGKPMQGDQADPEGSSGKKDKQGLTGVGASGHMADLGGADGRVDQEQRALDRESGDLAGKKASKSDYGAEERPAVTSEELASEAQ